MINYQKTAVGGFLGADATFQPLDGSRVAIRFNVATNDRIGNEKVTSWHQCYYVCESPKELKMLQDTLVQGAAVLVDGRYRFRMVPHPQYPIEVLRVSLFLHSLQVVSSPRRASEPASTVDDEFEGFPAPAVDAPAPAPQLVEAPRSRRVAGGPQPAAQAAVMPSAPPVPISRAAPPARYGTARPARPAVGAYAVNSGPQPLAEAPMLKF